MAKHSKKSKHNELDAILDRLKRSYGASSGDIEDSLLDSDESEEDAELNAILGKIFSDDTEEKVADEYNNHEELLVPDEGFDVNRETKGEIIQEDLAKTNEEDLSDDSVEVEKLESEEQAIIEESEESLEDSEVVIEDTYREAKEDIVEEEFVAETDEPESERVIEDELTTDDEFEIDDPIVEESEEDGLFEQEGFAVEDEEYDVSRLQETVECDDVSESEDQSVPLEENESEVAVVGKIILDPDDYTYDDLQNGLPNFKALTTAEFDKNHAETDAAQTERDSGLDNNDISLLLKFGYEEEVKTQIGEENTQKAVFERDNQFTPEPYKKLFGFCGKEFSSREQIPEIKAKYKADKKSMIVKLTIVSFISLMLLLSAIFFDFFSDRTSYPIFLSMEFLFVLLIGVVLYRELYSGVMGIIRFEAGLYSLLAFLIFEYILCSIVTIILYIANIMYIDPSDLVLFGFCFSMYAILTVVSDYVNCVKEYNTFILMTAPKSIYTAEKQRSRDWTYVPDDQSENSHRRHAEISNNAYKICEASMISGYFRKTYQQKNGIVNLIYILGVSPVIALLAGCVCALISGNVMRGVSSVMMTSMLCLPLSIVSLPALSEYIVSIKLKRQKAAFIGREFAADYSKADTLIFKDTDAINIVSITEIHPNDSSDEQTSIAIAKAIFSKLGGPLNAALNSSDTEVAENDIAINRISDNGLEILFDSSVSVLIGNRHYMNTHGIRVKTDSNLSTAIKGSDRSVIFMAFDGVPKLGFIINSNVKEDFWKTVGALEAEGIRTYIETYEPQINDLYFEQNKKHNTANVGVYKPEEYEHDFGKQMRDGCIISSKGSMSVADILPLSKEIVARRKANKRLNLIMAIVGVIVSCVFVFIANAPATIPFLGIIKNHIIFVFNAVMIIGFTPAIISLIRQRKSK